MVYRGPVKEMGYLTKTPKENRSKKIRYHISDSYSVRGPIRNHDRGSVGKKKTTGEISYMGL